MGQVSGLTRDRPVLGCALGRRLSLPQRRGFSIHWPRSDFPSWLGFVGRGVSSLLPDVVTSNFPTHLGGTLPPRQPAFCQGARHPGTHPPRPNQGSLPVSVCRCARLEVHLERLSDP